MICAETMFAFAVAEHNLPLSVADDFSDIVKKIVKKMFPDSVKKTKCTQIVKQALGPDSLLKKIQTEFQSDLGSDTIYSLICCKQNTDFTCVNFIPSDSLLLKAAKAATKAYIVSVCSEN